jgi:hypothetical protein
VICSRADEGAVLPRNHPRFDKRGYGLFSTINGGIGQSSVSATAGRRNVRVAISFKIIIESCFFTNYKSSACPIVIHNGKLMNFKISHQSITSMALCLAGMFTWSAKAQATPATDYQGAAAILRQAVESSNQMKAKDEKSSPMAQWRADLKTFAQQSTNMAPAEAAKQWLALADRLFQLEEVPVNNYGQSDEMTNPLHPQELMEALPPPADWAELAKAIEMRPPGEGAQALHELGLRLMTHSLTGDMTNRAVDIASLQNLAAKAKSDQAYFYSSLFEELSRSIIALQDNPDAVL